MSLETLQRGLAYRFVQSRLLEQAVTHRSYSADHNERLEFLGDSILNMVVAMMLFERFAQLREGELSRLRAQFVRQDSLQGIAETLGIGGVLHLGEGELKSGGDRRPSILADATEAIFGAVFLDGGFDAARRVIEGLYASLLADFDPGRNLKDPKTALQELLQARRLTLPRYDLVEIRGEAHAQEFEIACVIEPLKLRTLGVGNSRRAAEQTAAQVALEQIGTA
ncbi:MAG: ribonuclease [Rhodocyclales bacterium]|nr:ribonuclease [Rhodocyclales bacterium]